MGALCGKGPSEMSGANNNMQISRKNDDAQIQQHNPNPSQNQQPLQQNGNASQEIESQPNNVEQQQQTEIQETPGPDIDAQLVQARLDKAKSSVASLAGLLAQSASLPPRSPERSYYGFNWGTSGSTLVTALVFQMQVVQSQIHKINDIIKPKKEVIVTQGLGLFSQFELSWKPIPTTSTDKKEVRTEVTLDKFVSINFHTADKVPVPTGAQKFLVDGNGDFVSMINLDEIVNFAIETAKEAIKKQAKLAGESDEEIEESIKQTINALTPDRIKLSIVNSARMMWQAWVEMWTHKEMNAANSYQVRDSYGVKCYEFREKIERDSTTIRNQADKFLAEFAAKVEEAETNKDSSNPEEKKIEKSDLKVEQLTHHQTYSAVVESLTGRPHDASILTVTEAALISDEGERFENAVYKHEWWSFGWSDVAGLQSEERLRQYWNQALACDNDLLTQLQQQIDQQQAQQTQTQTQSPPSQ